MSYISIPVDNVIIGAPVDVNLRDGNGNIVTSQVNGSQRALDVGINVAGVQIDPRSIRALTASDVVTANQGGIWDVRLQDGAGTDLTSTLVGAKQSLDVYVANSITTSFSADMNYGVVGANTLRTAAQIGNATGAADFAAGNSSAQTLRVVVASDQAPITIADNQGDYAATSALTQVTSAAVSTSIVAANPSRRGLILYNNATKIAYVAFAATASTAAFTVQLEKEGTFILDKGPIYTGQVTAIWESGPSGSMMVTELTA